jgi:multiple sugar transport system substrate-binding protein
METRDTASSMKRRAFLTMTGAVAGAATVGGIPGILLAQKPPSFPKGTKLHLLEWVSFVPAADVELKRLGEEFGKQAGVEVTVELINFNDLNPRIASAIENKAGPDIIQFHNNWAHLYADGIHDVDELAEQVDKRDGGIYDIFRQSTFVGGRWKAVPMGTSPSTFAYRNDWFKEAGAAKFPDTMDEFRKVGTELKKKDRPIGQAFGHSVGDPNGWAYAVTWCFGGQEVDKEQKRVMINSKETIEALKFTSAMWKDALDEGGLAWDDSSNNRAYHAGTISATLNGSSIYFVAKRQFPDIVKVTDHGHMPKGPAGRFYQMGAQARAIMKHTKNKDVAVAFVRWLMDRPQYDSYFTANDGYLMGPTPFWEKHALWEKDPKLAPFKESVKFGRSPGWPGPPSRKASEAMVKYIMVDMYAQAIKGMKAEDAAKWAEGELKKAYA